METFKKAKQRVPSSLRTHQSAKVPKQDEVGDRLKSQKDHFEFLVKQYEQEAKNLERKEEKQEAKKDKALNKEAKIQKLIEKRMYDEILRKQRQSEFHRQEQHKKVQNYFLKMARDIEKERKIQESRIQRELMKGQKDQSEKLVKKIESIFDTRVQVLKEKLDNEKYERIVSQKAQVQVIADLSKKVKEERFKEVKRFEDLHRKEQIMN